MNFPLRPINVLNGIYLPETMSRMFPPGSIPIGEEPVESTLSDSIGVTAGSPVSTLTVEHGLPPSSFVFQTGCHQFPVSSTFQNARSISVGSLGWLRRFHRPNTCRFGRAVHHSLSPSFRCSVMQNVRLESENQTDNQDAPAIPTESCVASPVSTGLLRSSSCSIWWLNGDGMTENMNSKAVFSPPPHSDSFRFVGPSDQAVGHHLIFPGRSDFEDELVLEVAHFEVSEFLISELEYLNCITQIPLAFRESAVDEHLECIVRPHPSLPPSSFEYCSSDSKPESILSKVAVSAQTSPMMTGNKISSTTLPSSNSVHSPQPELFGFVRKDFFLDYDALNRSSKSDADSTDGDDLSCAVGYELLHTRFVTTMASDLITCCMEQCTGRSQQMAFLKILHQLLMQTCDADWAFRGENRRWNEGAKPNQLMGNRCSGPAQMPSFMDSNKNVFCEANPLPFSSSLRVDDAQNRRSLLTVGPMDHDFGPSCAVSERCTSEPETLWLHADRRMIYGSADFDSPSRAMWNNFFVDPSRSPIKIHENIFDRSGVVNAICAPLAYDLLISQPIPRAKRKAILANQNNRCAGCGTFVETRYLKRMRFCEFFGKFFCCVCHRNTLMILPGNVVKDWDFRMLPVSNIARDRLTQLHNQPLLRQSDFNPRIVQTQPSFHSCSVLRQQGNSLLPFVRFCPDARQFLTNLKNLPQHWLESPNLWSMADLCSVQDSCLEQRLMSALQPLVDHLTVCNRCHAQGFVCEICHSGHILFPFGQPNTATCPTCSACFHRSCLRNPKPENCPRCLRRSQRRKQYEAHATSFKPGLSDERKLRKKYR